ncbi:MAG: hypothetical protein KAT79_04160 [candidate division Zixibacteria bacterium]|nr:hypothetical protein [candidate division Zixibacteria bacterium]
MNPTLIAGTVIVNLALISYSIAIITEQRKHRVSRFVLIFLTTGIVLDIVATICMIIGSPNTPFSLHGFVGYSSLTGMLIDAILIWRYWGSHKDEIVPHRLHMYTRIAYGWWICAYITGALLVMLK